MRHTGMFQSSGAPHVSLRALSELAWPSKRWSRPVTIIPVWLAPRGKTEILEREQWLRELPSLRAGTLQASGSLSQQKENLNMIE